MASAQQAIPPQSYAMGVALCLAGALCWSSVGVLVRLTEGIDAWQIILYRSLTVSVMAVAWLAWLYGNRFFAVIREAGFTGFIAGVAVGLAGLTFVSAVFYTTVAQAIFMTGIAPFCAALLGWWLLRERVPRATWGAMFIALVGLAIMVGGAPAGNSVVGVILALYSAFCFSCYSVLLRWGQNTDMSVAVLWNGLFLTVFTASVLLLPVPIREAHGVAQLWVGWENLLLCATMGTVQLMLGLILFTRGSRSVPAAQLALLALFEPAISPVWVYLAVGEVPHITTIVGGVVVFAAVVVQILAGSRRGLRVPAV